MAKRMTVAGLAKIVAELSERFDRRFDSVERHFDSVERHFDAVDRRFEDVDRRFEDVDRRFDELGGQMRAIGEAIRADLIQYAEAWQAVDSRVTRLDTRNDAEHRLMQTQIDELDADLRRRRRPRRR